MIFKVADAKPSRKLRKRAFKGICEEDDEPCLVEEDLARKIIGKDELDVVYHDENFLYCPTKSQLPKIFSEIFGGFKPKSPSEKIKQTGKLSFDIEEPKGILIFEIEGETKDVMMSVYKFHRKVSVSSKEGKEKLDIMPLVQYYQKCVDLYTLTERIKNMIQDKWNKIHKGKKPAYVV